MAYRIQFMVTDTEYKQLLKETAEAGYSSCSALCYSRAFPNSKASSMYSELITKVAGRTPEEGPFVIRDILKRPYPGVVGVWFSEAITKGNISNVKALGRNNTKGAAEYIKL